MLKTFLLLIHVDFKRSKLYFMGYRCKTDLCFFNYTYMNLKNNTMNKTKPIQEPHEHLLNDTVNFRLNKHEKQLIKDQAHKLKMNPSTFIRFAFLNLIKTYHNEQ